MIVSTVPPKLLPWVGDTLSTTISYKNLAVPEGISIESPKFLLLTTTLNTPLYPPGILTCRFVSLADITLSL